MNAAQTINEYTTFLQASQKEYESKGMGTNFRRMADEGVTYFMQVTNGIRLDRIVQNEVVETLYPSMHEAVLTLSTGGWERV
ncbi:hypothetical protein EauM23_00058 [Exiguobacterium phage vB_EauM-23]|nr:hypothetical protein EauM23_00058 [Exiguobacterium phage vB_EauM-23]